MDIATFLDNIAAGKTIVRLTQIEKHLKAEEGEIINAAADIDHWPANHDPELCMVVVCVDDAFHEDRFDDGLRECSVSQIDCFIE
jgi:hypothetical protein